MSTRKIKKDSPGSAAAGRYLRTIVRVSHPGAAGPESLRADSLPGDLANNCSFCHPRRENYWYTKYCCWLRCWYLGYPEQFVGLISPATPNPDDPGSNDLDFKWCYFSPVQYPEQV